MRNLIKSPLVLTLGRVLCAGLLVVLFWLVAVIF